MSEWHVTFKGFSIPGKILRTLRLTGDGKIKNYKLYCEHFLFPTRVTRTQHLTLAYVITPTLLIFPSQCLKLWELFEQRTTQKPERSQLN